MKAEKRQWIPCTSEQSPPIAAGLKIREKCHREIAIGIEAESQHSVAPRCARKGWPREKWKPRNEIPDLAKAIVIWPDKLQGQSRRIDTIKSGKRARVITAKAEAMRVGNTATKCAAKPTSTLVHDQSGRSPHPPASASGVLATTQPKKTPPTKNLPTLEISSATLRPPRPRRR